MKTMVMNKKKLTTMLHLSASLLLGNHQVLLSPLSPFRPFSPPSCVVVFGGARYPR